MCVCVCQAHQHVRVVRAGWWPAPRYAPYDKYLGKSGATFRLLAEALPPIPVGSKILAAALKVRRCHSWFVGRLDLRRFCPRQLPRPHPGSQPRLLLALAPGPHSPNPLGPPFPSPHGPARRPRCLPRRWAWWPPCSPPASRPPAASAARPRPAPAAGSPGHWASPSRSSCTEPAGCWRRSGAGSRACRERRATQGVWGHAGLGERSRGQCRFRFLLASSSLLLSVVGCWPRERANPPPGSRQLFPLCVVLPGNVV